MPDDVKLGGPGMTSFGFDFHYWRYLRLLPGTGGGVATYSKRLNVFWARPALQCREQFFSCPTSNPGHTELWNAFEYITSGASATEKTALYSGTAARV